MITISESAKEQLQRLMTESNLDENYFLRVGVKGGGCAGFSYKMDFDTDFKEGDELFEDSGIKVVCDRLSLLYIFGTELHFSGGLNGKGFEWKNPNAHRTCSCGISFGT